MKGKAVQLRTPLGDELLKLKAGDRVEFGGLFGSATVIEVRNAGASSAFVRFGGRIPAPIQSLGN